MEAYIPEMCVISKCNGFWHNGLWNCYACNIVNGYQYSSYYGDVEGMHAWFGHSYDYYSNWSGCLQVIYDNCDTTLECAHTNVIVVF